MPLTAGFVYPDASVVCGDFETYDEDKDILLNPMVIVEVLSESTERFDRGDKFAGYRSIPSLVDYVLVSQHSRVVEVFTRRDDGAWILRAYDQEHPVVALPSLDITLSLDDLYSGVLEAAP